MQESNTMSTSNENEEFSVEYRKFSKRENQVAVVNHMFIVCLTVIEVLLLLGFVLQILTKDVNYLVIGFPTVVFIISIFVNWGLYVKDRSSAMSIS